MARFMNEEGSFRITII